MAFNPINFDTSAPLEIIRQVGHRRGQGSDDIAGPDGVESVGHSTSEEERQQQGRQPGGEWTNSEPQPDPEAPVIDELA